WIGRQVVEFIQVVISQAEFPSFRGDYSAGRFIHRAFDRSAGRELRPSYHLEAIGGPFHKNVFRWTRFAVQQWSQAFPGALIRCGFTEEIEQSRQEVDMTDRSNDSQALASAGQSNKVGNPHRFFEHDFFSK